MSKGGKKKPMDLLDFIEDEESGCGDEAQLLKDFTGSKDESFDDHQQWMIDTFKDL